MTFVILSLLALVFAACSDSGSGGGGGGEVEGPPSSSRTATGASLISFPFAGTGSDAALEGQPINLTGIRVAVSYSNGDVDFITDPRRFTIDPPIYHWSQSQHGGGTNIETVNNVPRAVDVPAHTLSLYEGGRNFTFFISNQPTGTNVIGNVRPLIDVVFTGSLAQQNFYIDEIPDFRGITIEGVYSMSNSISPTQFDWFQRPFTNMNLYEWRWVYNIIDSPANFANQDPGILMRFASWGNVAEDDLDLLAPRLRALRIPVTSLAQVTGVEFVTEPALTTPIFFDDQTLIGTVGGGWDLNRWLEPGLLGGIRIRVSYQNGTSREYNLDDVRAMTIRSWQHQGWDLPSDGALGRWVAPTIRWSTARDITGGLTARQCVVREGGGSAINWFNWATNRTPQIVVRHRGHEARIAVPIFSTLSSIEVTSRSGQLVLMDGTQEVWHRRYGQQEFLRMVRISATYTQNFDSTITATREDVIADINAGICRSRILTSIYALENVPVTSGSVAYNPNTVASGTLDLTVFNGTNSTRFLNDGREQRVTVFMEARDARDTFGQPGRIRNARVQIGLSGY